MSIGDTSRNGNSRTLNRAVFSQVTADTRLVVLQVRRSEWPARMGYGNDFLWRLRSGDPAARGADLVCGLSGVPEPEAAGVSDVAAAEVDECRVAENLACVGAGV